MFVGSSVRSFGWLLLGLLLVPEVGIAQPRFREHVEVTRVLIDARVFDRAGDPIEGLGPADFEVRVDGEVVPIESVEWVSASQPFAEGPSPQAAASTGRLPAAPGRLMVFFFQKDLEHSRLTGLMRMKHKAAEMVATLNERDRVAVLSFDSHLKLWLDFTADRERLREVIERSILFENEPDVTRSPYPSLAAYYDRRAAHAAASPEEALRVTAQALAPLPGSKSLVMFGWGMGEFSPPVVRVHHDYEPARRALAAARVTVFALDITDADWHTLEFGLQVVAADTGGFYARTNLFPDQAMGRLEKALVGHYVLVLASPTDEPGEHSVEVRLVGWRGTVQAPRGFILAAEPASE
jgi:VWFA-related protein